MCSGLLLGGPGGGPARAEEPPLVLAFYYAWYDQATWNPKALPDQPTGPYTSSDRATVERQVAQAQAAGIDALIQSWYGPQTAGNQTETNFRTLLDVAGARGFHAAVDFETEGPFFPDRAAVTDALRTLLATHAQHPAYLRYQGKPVVFFWCEERFGVDEWAAIRAQVDPEHKSLWIAEGVDIAYQAVFDGHHLYSVAWSPDVKQTLADWGFRVRRYAAQNGVQRLWVATAMPGYDDTHTDRQDAFAVARRAGGYYRETWAAAVASRPDWIVITSFNEWVEGTMIEPSVTYGDLYLNLTRELAQAFKGATAAAATPTGAPTSTSTLLSPTGAATATATAPPSTPFVRANEAVRIRSGPGADTPRLKPLYPGETAPVVGKSADGTWWQVRLGGASDGLGWVAAGYVTLVGDASRVPVAGAGTPAATAATTATPTAAARTLTVTATAAARATPTIARTSILTATAKVLTPTATPTPSATATPTVVPPTPSRAATPASSSTARPTLTPTHTPLPSAQPPLGSAQPSPGTHPPLAATPSPIRLPGATPVPTATTTLRIAPAKQRPPEGLLWLGGGALALAAGLGGILWRYARRARRRGYR